MEPKQQKEVVRAREQQLNGVWAADSSVKSGIMSDIGEDEAISFDGKFDFRLIKDDVNVG